MHKSLFFTMAVSVLLLSGCAIIRAQNEMEKSKAEYKECLKQYSDNLPKCEAHKRTYEADLEYWRSGTGYYGNVSNGTNETNNDARTQQLINQDRQQRQILNHGAGGCTPNFATGGCL